MRPPNLPEKRKVVANMVERQALGVVPLALGGQGPGSGSTPHTPPP